MHRNAGKVLGFQRMLMILISDASVLSALHESAMFSMLIPMVCAYISPVVDADPSVSDEIVLLFL